MRPWSEGRFGGRGTPVDSSTGLVAGGHSGPAAETREFPAIAFGRPAFPERFELGECFTLLCQFQAQFTAGVCFTVECLSHGGGSADLAQLQDINFEVTSVVFDVEAVPYVDLAGRFARLAVRLNPAQFTSSRGECARLEEAGRPEPLVHSDPIHDSIFISVTRKTVRARVGGWDFRPCL
jgi:hypothetical protein